MKYVSLKDNKVKFGEKDADKSASERIGELLLKSAKKDIENTTLKKQNADILLRLARNNIN